MSRKLFSAAAGIGAIAAILLLARPWQDDQTPALLRDVVLDPPHALGPVDLIDHRRNTVSAERFKGHWTFVLFGYMHCPDVCPLTLNQLRVVKQAISERSAAAVALVQVFFVSVDPARDTLERLAEYVTQFDPDFLGISGELQAIGGFERAMGAFHRYGAKDASGYYAVQHSAEVFLIDPTATLTAKFEPPMDPKLVARQLSVLAGRYEESRN